MLKTGVKPITIFSLSFSKKTVKFYLTLCLSLARDDSLLSFSLLLVISLNNLLDTQGVFLWQASSGTKTLTPLHLFPQTSQAPKTEKKQEGTKGQM